MKEEIASIPSSKPFQQVPFIGVSRHRIPTDGEGVTTLAAFSQCPL